MVRNLAAIKALQPTCSALTMSLNLRSASLSISAATILHRVVKLFRMVAADINSDAESPMQQWYLDLKSI